MRVPSLSLAQLLWFDQTHQQDACQQVRVIPGEDTGRVRGEPGVLQWSLVADPRGVRVMRAEPVIRTPSEYDPGTEEGNTVPLGPTGPCS